MGKLIVKKFGGTSVGDVDKIKNVANIIVNEKKRGNNVVVVVSAMGKTTDDLVKMAHDISGNPSAREYDMLLSTGEQVSIALLAMAVKEMGYEAISLTGSQSGVHTTDIHGNATINNIDTRRINTELETGKVVILAGFQGISNNNDITTLGRGGSDTSATAFAAALKADQCEIYTDVDGVFTADPRIVDSASLISEISYEEMQEYARVGASVLHPRSVEIASNNDVPLVVKSSFKDNEGTKITSNNTLEKQLIKGVSLDNNIAKISVLGAPDVPGIAFKLFSMLASAQIKVENIVQNINHEHVNDISFIVASDQIDTALQTTHRFARDVDASQVLSNLKVSKLSVVGTDAANNAYVAANLFEILYELDINIQMIFTTEIKISTIIETVGAKRAVKLIHDRFKV